MRRFSAHMVYVAVVLPLLCGCRKDLCYDHESHSFSVKTDVAASWEQEWERTYAVDWEQEWNAAWRRVYGVSFIILTGGLWRIICRQRGDAFP